jgi:hypothetical protein
VEGRVVATEDELILETAGGETMVVHVGPEWYREQHGYQITAGDQLAVRGFYWEGGFEAGQIDNQTTGQVIELRDENGFPLWGGRGRGRL